MDFTRKSAPALFTFGPAAWQRVQHSPRRRGCLPSRVTLNGLVLWVSLLGAVGALWVCSRAPSWHDGLVRRGWHKKPPNWPSLRIVKGLSVASIALVPIALSTVVTAPHFARLSLVRAILATENSDAPDRAFRTAWEAISREQSDQIPQGWASSALPRVDVQSDALISAAYSAALLAQVRDTRPLVSSLCPIDQADVAIALQAMLSRHFNPGHTLSDRPRALEVVTLTAFAVDRTLAGVQVACRPARLVGLVAAVGFFALSLCFLAIGGRFARGDILVSWR